MKENSSFLALSCVPFLPMKDNNANKIQHSTQYNIATQIEWKQKKIRKEKRNCYPGHDFISYHELRSKNDEPS